MLVRGFFIRVDCDRRLAVVDICAQQAAQLSVRGQAHASSILDNGQSLARAKVVLEFLTKPVDQAPAGRCPRNAENGPITFSPAHHEYAPGKALRSYQYASDDAPLAIADRRELMHSQPSATRAWNSRAGAAKYDNR